jgi:acyl-coenzyme A synthetase/AMP-(fatty) acid ligase
MSESKEGRGDRVAVYYEDQKYAYAEVQRMANRMANVLESLDVEISGEGQAL